MKQMIAWMVFVGVLVAASGCTATFPAATPDEEHEIRIVLTDYNFNPNVIRLQAGQKVTFVVSNQGDKMHEIMIGREVNIEGNLTEGFHEDFFAGITPEIHGPGMVMGLEGGDMAGMDGMSGDTMEHDMADMGQDQMAGGAMTSMEHDITDSQQMDEMASDDKADDEMPAMGHDGDMAEAEMPAMEHDDKADDAMSEIEHDDEMASNLMPAMEHDDMAEADMSEIEHNDMAGDAMPEMEHDDMAEGEMSGMEHDDDTAGMEHDMVETSFGALQRPLMDAHAGLMVMFDPSMIPANEVTTITFTVPENKIGEWELGCFQEQGQHYDDGMRGTLIVEPAS